MQRMSRTKGISIFFGLTALTGLLFLLPVVEQTLILSSGLIGVSRIFFSKYLYYIYSHWIHSYHLSPNWIILCSNIIHSCRHNRSYQFTWNYCSTIHCLLFDGHGLQSPDGVVIVATVGPFAKQVHQVDSSRLE